MLCVRDTAVPASNPCTRVPTAPHLLPQPFRFLGALPPRLLGLTSQPRQLRLTPLKDRAHLHNKRQAAAGPTQRHYYSRRSPDMLYANIHILIASIFVRHRRNASGVR